ncbi:MAG: amidohydrolase family protein [Planctomycetes bacterium]|nr:amidohydrolase family protein [Planctomycetota bacterium]
MDPIKWNVDPVIDVHTHYRGRESIAHYMDNLAIAGHTHAVLVTCRCQPVEDADAGAAYRYRFADEFKSGCPGRFYIFGGLIHEKSRVARGDGRNLAPQVAALIADGYDGIKMMEGSPYVKQALPHPLDHDYYRPFWDAAEEHAMPVTIHLANPVDCWTGDADPAMYRDADPQEEYFRQAEAVLAAHPALRINFAHFMFMGPQLDRLGGLFAAYPELRVDLAMGHEYMYCLSDDIRTARAFFIKWQDRILYGTDISDGNSITLARAKAEQVRLFLETEGSFASPYMAGLGRPGAPGPNGRVELRGMHLPPEVLRKIEGGNARTWLGPEPRPLPGKPGTGAVIRGA